MASVIVGGYYTAREGFKIMRRIAALFVVGIVSAGFISTRQGPDPLPDGISEEEITDELIARGKELFHKDACNLCHGDDGSGGGMAPDLTDDEWLHIEGSFDEIRRTVWYGVSEDQMKDDSHPFAMDPGGGLDLDGDTLDAVAAYAWSLTQKK